ncbi:asparagine synthase-related protein [Aurantiacibacter sediminis]|nr:asparagine synthase-related protein [Aurantiacibacter sediminis]
MSALRVHGERKQQNARFGNFAAAWTQGTPYTPEDLFDHQPMSLPSGSFLFVGRLDYRDDLVRALGLETATAAKMADSGLAMAAWEKWGTDSFDRLEGGWSLIVIDAENQRLTAARSPFHAPPLVYHESRDRFAISSFPRGLFALPTIPRMVDEERVADALILNFEFKEKTYFKDVFSLPSGHWMEVTRDASTITGFYDVDRLEPIRFARDEDYVEALDALMQDSVATSMRALKTPACTVSAGLDSSTVAVYALEALERGVPGLTDPLIGFTHVPGKDWDGRTYGKGRLGDESGPVKALAAMYPHFDVTFVASEGLPLDHGLDEVIRLSEMPPFGWNNLHWGAEIQRLTKETGRNVLLGGGSGNRTISFSNRYIFPKLFKERRWGELHRMLRALNIEQGIAKRYYRFVAQPLFPASVNKLIGRVRRDQSMAGYSGYSAINPDYAAEMRVGERAQEMGWDDSFSTMRSPQEMRKRMSFNGNREQNALMRAAMQSSSGVQSRDPLGCRRITEFCFAIPDEQYMTPGVDRWLVRRLMKDRLPREIVNFQQRGRQSADWHARFTQNLDRHREEFEAMAHDPDMAERFDIPRIRRVFDTWPDKTPLDANDHPDYLLAMVGMGRMFGIKRFINWVEGRNR